jgi:hypothetical protein
MNKLPVVENDCADEQSEYQSIEFRFLSFIDGSSAMERDANHEF